MNSSRAIQVQKKYMNVQTPVDTVNEYHFIVRDNFKLPTAIVSNTHYRSDDLKA